MIVISEIIILV